MVTDRHTTLQSLGGVDRHTLRELTLSRLREAISVGQLPPGTHLAEVELSEALSVSRGTLREALRSLQQEGLLQSDSRGRLSVRVLEPHQVRDVFSVRAALEALAFETICELPDRSHITRHMRELLDQIDDSASLSDRLEADLELHAALCRMSGNETLYNSWLSLRGLARASMTIAGPSSAQTNVTYARHLPIVELLEAGDADAGRAFLRDHMIQAADRIVRAMEAAESVTPQGH